MNDYITKPIKLPELEDAFARVLSISTHKEKMNDPEVHTPSTVTPVFLPSELIDRLMGDADLAHTIIDAFLDDIPHRLVALRTHLDEGDAGAATIDAHTIKGAGANVATPLIAEIAAKIERLVKSGRLEEARGMLPDIDAAMERLVEASRRTDWSKAA